MKPPHLKGWLPAQQQQPGKPDMIEFEPVPVCGLDTAGRQADMTTVSILNTKRVALDRVYRDATKQLKILATDRDLHPIIMTLLARRIIAAAEYHTYRIRSQTRREECRQ